MKKTILAVSCVVATGVAAVAFAGTKAAAPAAMPSCGQMTAEKAVLPAKMSELMTAVAEMYDAHIAFMSTDKSKEAMAEVEGMKKLAQEHRDIAAMYTKTAADMKAAATWPVAMHDANKMMADPKIMASMTKMLTTHKDMMALMQKEVAMMETMGKAKTN